MALVEERLTFRCGLDSTKHLHQIPTNLLHPLQPPQRQEPVNHPLVVPAPSRYPVRSQSTYTLPPSLGGSNPTVTPVEAGTLAQEAVGISS